MATYKVIQDIEAEDHILGPLSLRQFIYGLIAAFFLYLCFVGITKHAAFLLVIFLPPAVFCGFFAFPFRQDQPTEVWALARIRFLFKPRKRIWNQSGVKELVTITVPKKIIIERTDGLSQREVKSRLEALATTIDSRGWAVKNVVSGGFVQPAFSPLGASDDDRLVSISSMPKPVSDYEQDDVLDDRTSPLAQQFSNLIQSSEQQHRQQLIAQMNSPQPAAPATNKQWFANGNQAAATMPVPAAVPQAQTPTATEEELSSEIRDHLAAQAQANAHLQKIPTHAAAPKPQPAKAATPVPAKVPEPPVTAAPDPAILNLAKRNDLNVSTLAREAHKATGADDGEVVISLH